MQSKSNLLAGAVLAGCFAFSAGAAPASASRPDAFGVTKAVHLMQEIQIHNLKGDRLGRIRDVTIDLSNGRVVEVLVVSGGFLGMGGKVVSVPPAALISDGFGAVYYLNVSPAVFKAATEADFSNPDAAVQNLRIAAAYRHFGREPYFVEKGERAGVPSTEAKSELGQVERFSRLAGLPVENLQGDKLGKVESVNFRLDTARVFNVIIVSPVNNQTKTIIPAPAFSSKPGHKVLLLDESVAEFANEPHYVLTGGSFGHEPHAVEESYTGPRTSVALEQGQSSFDQQRTLVIKRDIKAAKINADAIEVGTMNGRVTLRGWTDTSEDQVQAGRIAVAASRLELVDNQLQVRSPVAPN